VSKDAFIASDLEFSFKLDKKIYSLEAVQASMYRLAGDLFLELEDESNEFNIKCRAKEDSGLTQEELSSIKDIFLQTLNDESLREKIRDETSDLRELIIATTFSGVLKGDESEPSKE